MNARQRVSTFLGSCSRVELYRALAEPWFSSIFPGIARIVGCDQGPYVHLEGDVAVHTSFVYENLLRTTVTRLGREADFIERLAAVWHDACKPDTRVVDEGGAVSFPGHEARAAAIVPQIAASLTLSPIERDKFYYLVANHGLVHGYPSLGASHRASLLESPWIKSLAVFQEADALSCILPGGGNLPVHWEHMAADIAALEA